METETARKALAERLPKESDEKLMIALIDGLRAQKNSDAIEAVREILSRTPPLNVTAAAVRYLAAVEKGRAVELIDSLVALEVAPITVACADAFALVEHEGVVPRLAVLFNDPDKVIRAAAFSNLVKVDSSNIDFYLRKALDDDDFVPVALALDVIEQQLLGDYLPAMRTMISRGTAIKADLRRALVSAAGKFLKKDRADSLALAILVEGALDRDYIVRREAVDIYRDVLGEDRSDMLRSAKTHISVGRIENAIEKYQSNPYATIITSKGEVEMELYLDVAPLAVLNFIELASIGFYDSLSFHRVVPNFVVQGGDPHGDGLGGPGYYIRCEYSAEPYRRGTVGIATSGKDTGGSQFFITHSAQPHLEGRYTVFGQVLSGMDVIDEIVPGDLIVNIVIEEG
jgi:cyclophilin family peptidyl-prolyl cis-trans isomerase